MLRPPRPSAYPRIAVSGVFSSWLTESRKFRSASREAASCSAISLNARASEATSVPPSCGSGSCCSSAASALVAAATRRIGRAIERAIRNDSAAARPAPASAANSRSRRNGLHSAERRLFGPQQEQAAGRDRAVRVEIVTARVDRLPVAGLVDVENVLGELSARLDENPDAARQRVLVDVADVRAALLREIVGAARQGRDLRLVDLAAGEHRADRRSSARASGQALRASLRTAAPAGCSWRDGLVAGAAQRADQLRAPELAAQLRDVDVDGARAARILEPPDAVEQQVARDEACRCAP